MMRTDLIRTQHRLVSDGGGSISCETIPQESTTGLVLKMLVIFTSVLNKHGKLHSLDAH